MSETTSVSDYVLGQWYFVAVITNSISSTATYGIKVSQPFIDATGSVITGNFFMNVLRPSNNFVERIYVPANGVSSDGLTIGIQTTAEVTRGLVPTGNDPQDGSQIYAFDFQPGDIVAATVDPIIFTEFQLAFLGQIGATLKFNARPGYMGAGISSNAVFATTAARDAAITMPQNGDVCYVTADGVNYQYIAGAWNTYATGTISNASTTVAGKVQEATTAQVGASTTTGSTGAPLFINPGSTVQASSGAGDQNSLATLNAAGQFADGFINVGTSLTAGENLTAGQVAYVAADGKAYKTIVAATNAAQVGAISGTQSSITALNLSEGVVINAYVVSNAIKAEVVTITRNSASPGTETSIVASGVSSMAGCVIATNTVVYVYRNTGDSNKFYGVVCTISGSTITAGTPVKLYDTEAIVDATMSVCPLNTNKFIAAAANAVSNDPACIVCTVSGTVITAGTEAAAEAVTMAGATKLVQLSTDAAVVFYDDGTNVTCKTVSVSGTTSSFSTALDLYAGTLSLGGSALIMYDNYVVAVFNRISTTGIRVSTVQFYNATAFGIAGQYITNSDYQINANVGIYSVCQINDRKMALISTDQQSSGACNISIFTILDGGFQLLTEAKNITGMTGNGVNAYSICPVSTSRNAVIAFGNFGDSKLYYSVFLDTSLEYMGIVATTTSASSTVPIITAKNATVSGVVAGQEYYVGNAGTLATSGLKRLGVATSTTNLYLN